MLQRMAHVHDREQGTALDPTLKGATGLEGRRPAELAPVGLMLVDLPTPLAVTSRSAISHNVATMAAWCAAQGIAIAPHGKTTMAPALWRRQLDAGAWGITVATEAQLLNGVRWGVPRLMLADPLVRPAAAHSVRDAIASGAVEEVIVWVDSEAAIVAVAAASDERIGVLIDIGAPGGRTGVRTAEEVTALAAAVAAADGVTLRGVAGYEGALAQDRQPGYLSDLCDAVDLVRPFITGRVMLSVGGSAGIAATVAAVRRRVAVDDTDIVIRSGVYVAHDDGFYLDRAEQELPLRAAVAVWGRVLSAPEPGLALLDVGRRDVSYDQGLPVVLGAFRGVSPLDTAASITALNDQHAFVSVRSGAALEVGDLVELGVSHPCTTFDRWPVILEVDERGASDARVVGAYRTHF